MTRYYHFEKLKELTIMKKTSNGYCKFIQTGQLALNDYNTGFIDLEIYTHEIINGCNVIIKFGTIDDGDFGGWRFVSSKEKAQKMVDNIAENIFKDMISFPTAAELNKQLQRYGIAVDYE